jgi:hypothetical protein
MEGTQGLMCPKLAAGLSGENAPLPMLNGDVHYRARCIESKCAWWVTVYSTEGIQQQGCAIAIQAQQGRVVV